ncbi:hypothetical protein QOZ96_002445 [Brevundimonas nasdae]|nr:hypothetical protein [Brevundimonas nasdae]MDQ0452492.1 hypothetical protein [Brevundimonas nasdae]
MKSRAIRVGLGALALLAIGGAIWLWGRVGVAVWLDAAIAFCA